MDKEAQITARLRELAGKEDGWKTPAADYFEQLGKMAVSKPRPRWRASWLAAAATVLLLVTAALLLLPDLAPAAPPTSEDILRDIPDAEIEAYLLLYADELDEELLYGETQVINYE